MRYLPVSCFGKLPFWPEYLEANAGFTTSKLLKQWMHRGNEAAGLTEDDDSPRDVQVEAHLRLLIGSPGSTELLAGVLRPSRDRGGRHFPFAVFTHFPRKLYGKHYHLLPLALAPVWEMLDDAWESLAAADNRPGYEEMLGSIEVREPAPPGDVRGVYQGLQRDAADRLFRRGDGASLDELRGKLPEALERLRKGGNGRGVCLLLPVSADLDEASFDATFWIDLLNRQFFMRRFEPSVLLDEKQGVADRNLVFSFGRLDPEAYPAVMGLRDHGADVLRPVHGEGGGGTEGAGGLSYVQLLKERFS